ncbi:hypothetical protein PMAYCL1PPCAC_06912, partial [Pristionchus mayeri]
TPVSSLSLDPFDLPSLPRCLLTISASLRVSWSRMDLRPLGYHSSPTALTRTVQSILSPCLYPGYHDGPSSSACWHSWPKTAVEINKEGPLKEEEDGEPIKSLEEGLLIKDGDEETAIKSEEDQLNITDDEEKPSAGILDHYSETVDTVARNKAMHGKSRMAKPKRNMPQKRRVKKEKVKVKKRRLCANPVLLKAPLIVNEQLMTRQSNGRDQMWWFVLKILMNPANVDIAAWTGHYYSFRVIDKECFTQMWCDYNHRSRKIAWSSVCRAMRLCYGEKGILTPVSQLQRLWAFVVDISIPLKMTREVIQQYIDLHKVTPPIPITFNDNNPFIPLPDVCNDSAKETKTNSSSTCVPFANFEYPLFNLDALSLPPPPPSPLILSPRKLGSDNLLLPSSPLSSEAFSDKASLLSPISSPYWLPAPVSSVFSPYFRY